MTFTFTNDDLSTETRRLVQYLEDQQAKIVFAESCTGGLVAAALVEIPGVSSYLCGSAAVYRNATKVEWLGVSSQTLQEHGAVSREVVTQMAQQVLRKTPEADLSAAVTGYLGPNAPRDEEGRIYVAVALRHSEKGPKVAVREHRIRGRQSTSRSADGRIVREEQQRSAAYLVLREINVLVNGESITFKP